MMIYPAPHYTMGGLWVDYHLMTTIPGLFVLGEANFSDHGANRLGASALMQGLADGYFVIPYTLGDYLAQRRSFGKGHHGPRGLRQGEAETWRRRRSLLSVKGKKTVREYHWHWATSCGTTWAWPAPRPACRRRIGEIKALRAGLLEEPQRARLRRGAQQESGDSPAAWPTSSSWAS
jgi:succinate dehydrogenase / fumarate reductase flavoprotein subunit